MNFAEASNSENPAASSPQHNDEGPLASVRRSPLSIALALLERIGFFRAAMLLFILTVTVSVVLTYVVRPLLHRHEALGGEGYDGYLELGVNLARGHGYVFEPGGHKVFHRPPLYPALLAPCAFLSEPLQRIYVACLNSALFAAASIGVFLIGNLLFGRRVAWLSWLIFALNPPMILTAKNAVSAICQALAYTMILYFWLLAYRKASAGEQISRLLAVGLIGSCFAGVMCHGTMLAATVVLLALFATWSLWTRRFHAFKSSLVIALSLTVLIAPWTWRNHKVTGMFIPVAGNAGLAYFAGNAHWGITLPATVSANEDRYAALLRHAGLANDPTAAVKMYGFTTVTAERIANARMKEHIRRHPGDFLRKTALNAVEYYFPIIYYLIPPANTSIAALPLEQRLANRSALRDIAWSAFDFVMIMVAVSGAIALLRQRRTRFVAVCLIAAWAAYAVPYFPFLCFVGNSPYTFGTFPILAILTAAFLSRAELRDAKRGNLGGPEGTITQSPS